MSFFLPDGTTLQLSTNVGDISHQGILSSNLNGTEVQQGFPTTSTGTSTGNYNHLGIDGQNNNKWDFLNISGDLDGGFNLWHSSSTHAPLLIASVDDTGLTIDRSTSGTPPLLSPPILSIPDGSHINFSADLTQPPYNMVYQDLSANPVYMTQTNSFYTTGELVYAFVTSPTQVQLFKNDPNTNPIPPNTVPSGFPTTNTAGLVIGQPVFAFSLPPPTITKSSVLTGDTLSFNATSFSPTVLNQTGLTITDDNNNSNTVSYNQTVIRNSSNGSSTLSSNAIQINNGAGSYTTLASSVAYYNNNGINTIEIDNSPNMTLIDTTQTYSTTIDNTRIMFGEVNGLQCTLSRNGLNINVPNGAYVALTPSSLNYYNGTIITTAFNGSGSSLTFNDGTNNSQLTTTDILFNSVSLKSTVSTNTSNIATNTSNIATNTSAITTLQIKQTTTSNQNISSAITADGRPPIAPTTTIAQQYAFTPSWYFHNTSAGYKINWYMGGDIGMTVSQVLGLYMNVFNPSMTSNDLFPFITAYTVNDQPNPPNFYKSKRTYLFNQAITPVVNTRYFMFQNVSGSCPTPFHYGSVLNNMQLSTVAGSNVGAFAPTETILAFAIGSNSASAVNSVEFAINKFGIMTPYGTQEIAFLPN